MNYFNDHPLFINNPNGMVSSPELLHPRLEIYDAVFSSHVNGASVLDVACCDGRWSGWALANKASHVTGFDINEDFINLGANVIMPQYFDTNKYSFSVCDWENFTHQDSFDVVLLLGIIHFGKAKQLITKFAGLSNKMLMDAVTDAVAVDGTHVTLADITDQLTELGFSYEITQSNIVGDNGCLIVAER